MGHDFDLRNLHIEVTTRCNLNCIYCLRRFWSGYEPRDMDFNTYLRILDQVEGLERINLYGFGEPFMNSRILDMIYHARRSFRDSKIFLSTNGMLLDESVIEKAIKRGLNSIAVSIDTINLQQLRKIRVGSSSRVLKSLNDLCKIGRRILPELEIGVECVILKHGIGELPKVVEYAADMGVDYVQVSHVVPYSKQIYEYACYTCVSEEVLSLLGEDRLRELCEIRDKASLQALLLSYAGPRTTHELRKYFEIVKDLTSHGYTANLTALCEEQHKISLALRVREVFEHMCEVAKSCGVELRVPKIFSDAADRTCPYEEKHSIFVRSDGRVTPCMELAYTHPEYVNSHNKLVHEYLIGDVRSESLSKILSNEGFKRLREMRKNLTLNSPWCGDCPYSELECWFVKDNLLDCYGNSPSCSECLYSVGLASCII